MMSDLTRRIQDQMESQNNKKTPQIEALLKEVRKLEEYKTKVRRPRKITRGCLTDRKSDCCHLPVIPLPGNT